MKVFLQKVINLGVDESQNSLDKRRVKTVNLLNVIVAFFLITGLSNYYLAGPGYPVIANLIFFAFCLLSLILSKLKLKAWAFLVFTTNVNSAIFFINESYPQDAGSYLFYFPMIISIVLLNNPVNVDRFAFLHFVISGAFFIGTLTIEVEAFKPNNFTPEQIKVVWYYNLVISCIITALLSVLLTRLIANQNREMLQQNADLAKTKEEVNASLKEKEILLAELHHRVKNNLAIITGLLNLQEDATNNDETRQALSDSKARIMSMALVHKMLYDNSNLKSIQIDKYIRELVMELFNSCNLSKKVKITFNCANIVLPVSKSIPLGLIINEIVTNSIKYVYRAQPNLAGEFDVSILTLGEV